MIGNLFELPEAASHAEKQRCTKTSRPKPCFGIKLTGVARK